MDESWRMRMGMASTTTTKTKTKTNLRSRSSVENTSNRRKPISGGDSEALILDSEDFSDVFGGPPRSVLHRQSRFAGEDNSKSSSNLFYEEMFRPSANSSPGRSGRNLPAFRIPSEKCRRKSDLGFYGDVFGCDEYEEEEEETRTRTKFGSKLKASSSSVLSSEDVSHLRRPLIGDWYDDDVSFFVSKLRPINVRSRLNSTQRMDDEYQGLHEMPAFSCHPPSYSPKNKRNDDFRTSNLEFNRRNSSPATISLDPSSYSSHKLFTDDFELSSPSSVYSSLYQDRGTNKACRVQEEMSRLGTSEQDEEDEFMSSYVIEINPGYKERTEEAIGVDEAIAWAKEKFQRHCSE